jgi:hypothetical protein
MGYYINTRCVKDFRIKAEDFPRIARQLLDTGFLTDINKMKGGKYSTDGKVESWYAWVDMQALHEAVMAADIETVLGLFRFSVTLDTDTGDIIDLDFDSKAGDEHHLFKAIAPWVTGMIEWMGEEGETWVWVFNNTTETEWINDAFIK